jgi:hypothetical protein
MIWVVTQPGDEAVPLIGAQDDRRGVFSRSQHLLGNGPCTAV